MNNMIIYHGSKYEIKEPTYGKGRADNDYGYGFYCTQSLDLAKEWACPDNNDGYANKYLLDLTDLKILDLTKKEYNILNWMALLLKNRIPAGMNPNSELARNYIIENFSVDLTDVDIIIGYRADDSYFSFARDFVSNQITLSQLSKAMELGKLGTQVVLHSEKSFTQITFLNSIVADNETFYTKRIARDVVAKKEYKETTRYTAADKDDLFVMDIIRQGVKNDDKRLQRNISK